MGKSGLDQFISSADTPIERFYIPCSIRSLNRAIDNKHGFMSGKFVEIVGTESTGKSTLAYDLIKNAQRLYPDKIAAYVDVERAFNRDYAQRCGVNLQHLQIVRADTAENNLAVAEMLARRGASIIIIDSVTFLIPSAHNDDTIEDENVEPDYEKSKKMAALGSLLGDWCKRMTPIADYHNTLIVFINQYRANFSTMSRQEKKPYGPFAYRHALDYRIELARIANEDKTATVRATVTKNRLGRERLMAEYDLVYGKGLHIKADLLKLAVEYEIVTKGGSWYTFDGKKVQGEKQAFEQFDFDIIADRIDNVVE